MSTRDEIIDAKDASTASNGLVYTCKGGWIDLGHARADGPRSLWNQVLTERGNRSRDNSGYRLDYQQAMTKFWVTKRSGASFWVKYHLSKAEKESVALAILHRVSLKFEGAQGALPWRLRTDSGFSAEDLVSNLVGFYRAVRPEKDYIALLKPVSKEAALKVWDKYGATGANKNLHFAPFLYPCTECPGGVGGPACGVLPHELNEITAAEMGPTFREWRLAQDWQLLPPSSFPPASPVRA